MINIVNVTDLHTVKFFDLEDMEFFLVNGDLYMKCESLDCGENALKLSPEQETIRICDDLMVTPVKVKKIQFEEVR